MVGAYPLPMIVCAYNGKCQAVAGGGNENSGLITRAVAKTVIQMQRTASRRAEITRTTIKLHYPLPTFTAHYTKFLVHQSVSLAESILVMASRTRICCCLRSEALPLEPTVLLYVAKEHGCKNLLIVPL
ncbi:hypothetical protein AVEN_206721-1 [Araneus ventricosus]|uniref:Uncharacterized protein n=1 Tax=Araneus ventricosus TaxID=182803 RepID=A0A4Y2M8Z2_ARAVE|nr:hypothetical protein AVEN_206721-1 [Araneus ventricosus]